MSVDTEETTGQPNRERRRKRSMREYYGTFSASPLILFILGAAALGAAVFALGLEIRTSELLVYKAGDSTVWYVLEQPYLLFVGLQPMIEKLSWLYGWGVEIVDLIFAFALNHVTHALKKTNTKIAKFFGPASFILVALNCWSNVNSLPGLDPMIQGLVGLVVACCVVVFPVAGLALIERGIEELGD